MEVADAPINLKVVFQDNTEPVAVEIDSVLKMMFEYHPKVARKLFEQSIARAKSEHRLALNKQYHCIFK